MSSELNLLQDYKRDKPPAKWCVYYEEDTGDVVTVTNREKDFIKHNHIVTDSDDARRILMGIVDPKKYAVVDVNQELKLVEKSAVLRIKEAEQRLSMIPAGVTEKADVNIVLYINHWKMEVNFNQDTLYRMTGKRYFRNVSLNPEQDGEYDPITLYLIKDNDPNFLVKTIEIDPAELIEEGYIIFDMTPLRRICGLGEISIMTKKIFSSYRLQRKANFTGVDYKTRFTRRRMFSVPTPVKDEAPSDFTIINRRGLTYIKSNFNNPQDQKIYTDIGIYLTNPQNPNDLLGQLTLPLKDIGWESQIQLEVADIDLTKCGFLCKETSTNLTFDYMTEIS
tara:strand:- start:125 stop:1132 length:1008 start_codon:yes stop_codon:yes gene_type:complete